MAIKRPTFGTDSQWHWYGTPTPKYSNTLPPELVKYFSVPDKLSFQTLEGAMDALVDAYLNMPQDEQLRLKKMDEELTSQIEKLIQKRNL